MNFRNKPRRKRSPIWTIPSEILQKYVKESLSITELLRKITPFIGGQARHSLMRRLIDEKIDISHIKKYAVGNDIRKRIISRRKRTNEEMFTEDSDISGSLIRKRLLDDKIIPYNCDICKCDPIWRNSNLTLVLDHINGTPNDNRLENLRFLCPNCNSQTDTFAGRNSYNEKNGYVRLQKKNVPKVYKPKTVRIIKVDWSKVDLPTLKLTMNNSQIAKMLGISETMVRKKVRKIPNI